MAGIWFALLIAGSEVLFERTLRSRRAFRREECAATHRMNDALNAGGSGNATLQMNGKIDVIITGGMWRNDDKSLSYIHLAKHLRWRAVIRQVRRARRR